MATTFSNKAYLLGQLWSNYRGDEHFVDFVEYNDLGLPLAYLIDSGLCESTDKGIEYINETWDLFLESIGIDDTGFNNLDDMFLAGEIVIID